VENSSEARQLASSYLITASEEEHRRMITLARRLGPALRDMCARADIRADYRVIDVGCGPIGALVDLAEIVGPHGAVVGIDSSADAIATAESILAELAVPNVTVLHGDINTVELARVHHGRLFDAAHMRLVLMHQPDPSATLRRVSKLLRPGGRILVADLLDDPTYPWFEPPVPATRRALEVMWEGIRRRGGSPDLGRRMGAVCAAAGLEVVDCRPFAVMEAPDAVLETLESTLRGSRRTILEFGVATDAEVRTLEAAIAGAKRRSYTGFVGPLIIQTIARLPEMAI